MSKGKRERIGAKRSPQTSQYLSFPHWGPNSPLTPKVFLMALILGSINFLLPSVMYVHETYGSDSDLSDNVSSPST